MSPASVSTEALLRVDRVAAGYGLMPVLHGLSIEVRAAEIVAPARHRRFPISIIRSMPTRRETRVVTKLPNR